MHAPPPAPQDSTPPDDCTSISVQPEGGLAILDQTALPWHETWRTLDDLAACLEAIVTMQVRGAPLIGAVAAFGLALALRDDPSDAHLETATRQLLATRPTAVNLAWALARVRARIRTLPPARRAEAARQAALEIVEHDRSTNLQIGRHGLALLHELARERTQGRPLAVLTHCNAGWLATCGWGTALAPLYLAHRAGLDVMVWVDETRPRNQGASLTCWELARAGIPHRLVCDNAGGYLIQRGQVDLVLTGADRVSAQGDVCNKIGTYLKALAARAHGIDFRAAVPQSTIDRTIQDGVAEIPVEERSPREITHMQGLDEAGRVCTVRIAPRDTRAVNPAFDVTPAALVSGLITEHGCIPATPAAIAALPDPDPGPVTDGK